MRILPVIAALATAVVALGACEDDPAKQEPMSDGKAECEELGTICHESDTGSGLAAECHELGHVGDGAACLARYDECKSFCLAQGGGGAGAHPEGGSGGESHHGNVAGAGGESHHGNTAGAGGDSHHGGAGGESHHGGAGGHGGESHGGGTGGDSHAGAGGA